MIVLLPTAQEILTVYALRARGFAISTIRGKSRRLNVARDPVPVLTNVVRLPRRPGAFDFPTVTA